MSNTNTVNEIEELIKQTNNVETKAILLILYKIADSLQQNTQLTQQVAQDLKDQDTLIKDLATDYRAKTSAFNGGGKVIKYVFGLLQVILIGIISYFVPDYIELKESYIALETKVEQIHSSKD